MTTSDVILPEEIQKQLAQVVASSFHNQGAKKVFIGLTNMGTLNVGLILKLFSWARNPNILPYYSFVTEKRHTDYARNILVTDFLRSNCEFMAMIDSDVDPHSEFLSLINHGKDIIGANTHCWINNTLLPSVWQRAPCEECVCVKKYVDECLLHDPSQYMEKDGYLWRWEPIHQQFNKFANKSGILGGIKCRCQDTGADPWVYKTWQHEFEPGTLVNVDALGAASMIVSRRVIEAIKPPHFMFYYKPSRQILLTEDYYFCVKAKAYGFEIWANLEMVCRHYKTVDLSGIQDVIVKAFNAGMEHQKTNYNIILPTGPEIAAIRPLELVKA
jgi:hypothetical protein